MSVFHDGNPWALSDCSVNPFLVERDGREFALPDDQMLSFGEDPMEDFLFQAFHSNNEIVNSDILPLKIEDLCAVDNSSGAPENSFHEAQIFNELVPKWTNQMMNSHGAVEGGKWLGGEEKKRVELIQLMLASGELIGNGEYEHAALLVSKCKKLSSQLGNPTERLAFYVSDALHQRILRISTNAALSDLNYFGFRDIYSQFDRKCIVSLAAFYISVLPYTRLLQFTAVQAIIDAVGNEKIIHVIDLGIRTGSQWTVLMQYLAHRAGDSITYKPQILKITAVGMNGEELRKIGNTLQELAKSLGIRFFYKMLEIQNMEEIKSGIFSVQTNEAVAVYAPLILRNLLYSPVLLVEVLSVIKQLRPRIMVTVEGEAMLNSPSFVNRLSEVIYKYSAFFDLLDVTIPDRNDNRRVRNEELIEGNEIRNIIIYEGNERRVRTVTTGVWMVFFSEAGFTQMNFSFQALYQARLLLMEYASGKYYTLEPAGHAIVVRWKGTPLFALSAWTIGKTRRRMEFEKSVLFTEGE